MCTRCARATLWDNLLSLSWLANLALLAPVPLFPSSQLLRVMHLKIVKVQDVVATTADYLSFGYWVQATEKDGETTYGVSTFFGGRQPFDVTG